MTRSKVESQRVPLHTREGDAAQGRKGTRRPLAGDAHKAAAAKPKPKPDDEAQSRRFIEDARKIGAAEEDSAADALMSELAKRPPDPHKPKK